MVQRIIDITRPVVCGNCRKDYTHSDEEGGFIFDTIPICPKCEPYARVRIWEEKEESLISAECPKGMSFREFILSHR
jgi:hypothetical protein